MNIISKFYFNYLTIVKLNVFLLYIRNFDYLIFLRLPFEFINKYNKII